MIRSETTRRMVEYIRAHGQADTHELARVAGIPTGEVSCRLLNHVRNGTLRFVRPGEAGKVRTVYGIGDGTKIEFQTYPRPADGVCACSRPAIVWKSGAKVCAVCAAAQARNHRAGLLRAERVRLFGSDRSLDKYREQNFHAFGKLAKLAKTYVV